MQTYWKASSDKKNYHIDLKMSAGKVTVYEDTGHWKSGTGGNVTFEEFLEGRFQDLIRRDFGEEVLAEVIESVKGLSEK